MQRLRHRQSVSHGTIRRWRRVYEPRSKEPARCCVRRLLRGLIGEDDTRRLFAELSADPDRLDVRPQEAYQAILSSMQPGWTLRLLQLLWPDPEPRLAFQAQVQRWKPPEGEGLDILQQGLLLAVQEYSLPCVRRTILEFVLPGDEGLAW